MWDFLHLLTSSLSKLYKILQIVRVLNADVLFEIILAIVMDLKMSALAYRLARSSRLLLLSHSSEYPTHSHAAVFHTRHGIVHECPDSSYEILRILHQVRRCERTSLHRAS